MSPLPMVKGDGRRSSRRTVLGKSVSDYGALNAVEDFAEVHKVMLLEFKRLSKRWRWLREPVFEKKLEILRP